MKLLHALLLLITLFFSVQALAEGKTNLIKVGDTLAIPALSDQFDEKHSLNAATQWIVFTHDMGSSKVVRKAFEGQTTTSLGEAKIQYYADISAMPSLISRFVAIPKMKKLEYAIVMDREGDALNTFPKEEDKVTLVKVENSQVMNVTITDDAEILKSTLLQ